MEERVSLREFQAKLAERLKAVAEQPGEAAKLGFMAAGQHWLVDLDQVSEVVTVPRLTPAPWTQPWFLGVAGIHGTIYACTDWAAFMALPAGVPGNEIRLLLANPRFGAYAGFRIDRALGLRNAAGMRRLPVAETAAPWEIARFGDGEGLIWREVNFGRLLAEPRFLQVAA